MAHAYPEAMKASSSPVKNAPHSDQSRTCIFMKQRYHEVKDHRISFTKHSVLYSGNRYGGPFPVDGNDTPGVRAISEETGRKQMSLGTIILIVVVLMLIGAIPTWPHSRGWGYGPSGGLGLVLIILIILILLGRL
jgi:hypothetical protein